MQIARGVTLPSKCCASRFKDSRRVFTEISNAVHGSKIWWRGRSFAASVPSDSSKPKRQQKRLSKAERRAMVESFVDEFRASNAGKFPTPSVARKHLGGSYYVIRQILQELEYRSKLPPISKKVETLLEKEEVVKHETRIKVEDKLSCEATVSCTSCEPDLRIEENNHMTIIDNKEVDEAASQHFKAKEDLRIEENNHMTAIGNKEMDEAASQHFKAKEGPKVSPWIENALSEESEGPTPTVSHSSVGTPSIQRKLENKDVLHPYPEKLENSKQKEATHENLLDSNGKKGDIMKEAGKETRESDRFERDIAIENKEPSQKRSTVWGSLKSFADGIINLWRKM